jgi:hypothetical protein
MSNPNETPKKYSRLNSLQGIYKEFITTDEIAAAAAAADSNIGTESDFSALVDLLFPKEPGFYPGATLWGKLKGISSTPRPFKEGESTGNFLAQKLRFYYYDGTATSSPIEQEIKNWYITNGRPSAYNYLGIVDDDGKKTKGLATEGTLRSLLDASKPIEGGGAVSNLKTSLTMMLVDTPSIDLKMRNADVTSTFMNYMPTLMMSQLVPYLDVRFVFDRKITNLDEKNRTLTVMSQLKFLLGSEPVDIAGTETDKNASALIYDATVQNKYKNVYKFEMSAEDLFARRTAAGRNVGKYTPPDPKDVKPTKEGNQSTTTGMELFTMPQTMINMDYDQETAPRYNAVLNKTLPFGTISSFTADIKPSTGLFSFRTATLTLKIFDRSRLVEIADFLNPKLYQATTIWVTYGWRAPSQTKSSIDENVYNSFINENMMKREAYGVRNSSISIDSSGIATVTLSLFTKGMSEMIEVSPTIGSAEFELEQEEFEKNLREIKTLAEELGLSNFTSGAKDIRGSQVIGAALGGTIPNIDKATLMSELKVIRGALAKSGDPRVTSFLSKVEATFGIVGNSTKTGAVVALDTVAARTAKNRFDALKNDDAFDFFAIAPNKFKNDAGNPVTHPLSKLYEKLGKQKNPQGRQGQLANLIKGYGDVSFARLFATYFASAARTIENGEPVVNEYQIIFYNFNDYAGTVANVNIGDFPIDTAALEKKYAEVVVQKKGERMTLVNFLEVVRESQFGDIKNIAFGFSDLYDEKGSLKQNQDDVLLQRQVFNEGLGSAFTMPAVDFFVETAFVTADATRTSDLLTSFEAAATSQASGVRSNRDAGSSKIIRIHIYDKAGTPHKSAVDILRDESGAFVEVESAWKNKYRADAKNIFRSNQPTTARQKKTGEPVITNTFDSKSNQASSTIDNVSLNTPVNVRSTGFGNKGTSGKVRFETVKRELARHTPSIIIGTNGTAVKNVSYSSNQDALLSTIMMLKNQKSSDNPSLPNGSGQGDLPLRVIPGQLSLSTMGCPTVEYMQQYFVDLGTGTTIDNMYNVVGVSHTISPGNFTSEITFGFWDAYGKYEGAEKLSTSIIATMSKLSKDAKESIEIEERNKSTR